MQLRSPEVTKVNFHLSYLGARVAKDLQLELEGGQGLPAWRAESEGIELNYGGWTPSCL